MGSCSSAKSFSASSAVLCSLHCGKRINDEFAEQNRLLIEAKTHIVYQQGLIREAEAQSGRHLYSKLEASKKMIESVIEMMEIEERDNPIKILGLKTNGGLVTILAGFTSILGAVISSTMLQ